MVFFTFAVTLFDKLLSQFQFFDMAINAHLTNKLESEMII